MKITIWDSTPARCTASAAALKAAAAVLAIDVEVQCWTDPQAPRNDTLSPQCDLLLLHATDENPAIAWFRSKSVTLARVLKYGGREISGGVPRAVSDTSPFKDFEAKGILEAVRDSSHQESFLDRALAIWSSVPQDVLSWALLEAYGREIPEAATLLNEKGFQDLALTELRERSGNPNLDLSPSNAQKEIARHRADI